MFGRNIPILAVDNDRIVFDASPAEVRRLLAKHQVRWIEGKRRLRLTGMAETDWRPRTHTSRGSFMGAIGRSQDYTRREHLTGSGNQVTGLKTIYSEDWGIYHRAVLDCMAQ